MKKLKLLILLFALFGLYNLTNAQCTSASYGQYPSSTFSPSCGSGFQNITTCGYRGEYSVVTVVTGNTYTFRSSISTDYITIANSSNVALVFGTGDQTWVATYDGTVRFYTHTSSACGSAGGCMTRSVECVAGGPACILNDVVVNMNDSYGDGWNGAQFTLADDQGTSVGTGTLSSGASGTADFCLADGCYTISVTGGSYPSEVSWTVDVNGTQVASGGANVVDASVEVNTVCSAPPPPTPPSNDDVCSAEAVTCNSTTSGTTVNATTDGLATCGTAQGQPGVWYRIEGNGDDYVASLCNTSWDSKISVFSGTCTNLTCVGGMDDNGPACSGTAASYSWTSVVGEIYYILVHSYSSTNTFDLEVTCTPPIVNPGPCTNTSFYTTTTMPTQTVPTKTISCQYAGEYTTWTGGEVGVTYTIGSSNSTDWITIRRDTYDGPVEVVGTTPVYLTPTSANQTYHFHINTNDLCGIESVCRDAQMTRQSALPVTMLYMVGKYVPELGNMIEWSTASEQNSDYFEMQISVDGSEYRSIGQIPAAGNSNSKLDYKWVDQGPLANAFNYYRLLQYDIDGASEIYGPVMIDNRNKLYKIVRRIDMMGREVGPDAKGVVIEIYEDGSMIRTINK